MTDRYTLVAEARLQQEIKRSRFLAQAAPVGDADAALAFIRRVSASDATHNCWAWRIGNEYRFNDDGEPGGSAGRPILAAIDGQQLDQVAVVVTRWFGGTKLGVGGLVRAYGGCTAECLRTAPRRALVDLADVEVDIEFALLASLHARLDEFAAIKVDEAFGEDGAMIGLRLPADRVAALGTWIQDLSRGRAQVRPRVAGSVESTRANP